MKKKILAYVLCFVTVFALGFGLLNPIIASAGTKEDYAEAQQKLDEINKTINSLRDQEKKLESKKKNAQSQIDLVKKQIDILKNDISRTSKALEEKQLELEQKKIEIEKTERLFKDRLKAMYIMRSGGTMSTILAVDSFSQLLTATDTLQRIAVADTDLLHFLAEQKRIIEQEEAEIQDSLNELVEKQGTMENKQSELAGLMKTLDSKLSDTEAEQKAARETQRSIYAEYIKAKQAMEAEFGTSVGEYVGGEYIWPVPTNGSISSGFGPRTLYGQYDYHTGIDINTGSGPYIMGQSIKASNSGTVTKAVYSNVGYGNYVIIDHGGGYQTLYGHCSSLAVSVGQYVTQGQTIAYVGSTGNSTGPHLHFELRVNGSAVDPLPYVAASRPAVR